MTLVNYEVYVAMRETRATEEQATAVAAAVTHRPFTAEDADLIRRTFVDIGVPAELAEAAAQSLRFHLR
jgi:hypothetical protein